MTQSKYASNFKGAHINQKSAPLDPVTGLYLVSGNGCAFHNNCFTCSEKPDKCHYGHKLKEDGNVLNQRSTLKPFDSYRPPEVKYQEQAVDF